MGLQRVRHDWATELKWTSSNTWGKKGCMWHHVFSTSLVFCLLKISTSKNKKYTMYTTFACISWRTMNSPFILTDGQCYGNSVVLPDHSLLLSCGKRAKEHLRILFSSFLFLFVILPLMYSETDINDFTPHVLINNLLSFPCFWESAFSC